jgi:hypothetical protein
VGIELCWPMRTLWSVVAFDAACAIDCDRPDPCTAIRDESRSASARGSLSRLSEEDHRSVVRMAWPTDPRVSRCRPRRRW